ncbi:flagellar basal body rod protein FlgG [Bacillus massiliigorillae]|uniref:flagellar basal body rod protein FlgG n=1 Tax=Bacillus massiliigorillae TaxID=1243664 RepID=UPI0003A2B6EB|nr:flagellar basal body rod protein FlgG [Bacillus massiliigorillae]
MLRSMYSGISGLKNFQTKLDVIGNNIANVNTFGFKKSRVVFKDMMSQNMTGASGPTGVDPDAPTRGGTNARQVGLGAQLAAIDTIHTGGNLQSTGRPLDLAISGDGYFVVGQYNQDGELVDYSYTRAGNFYLDQQGNLVNGDGYFVVGAGGEPAPEADFKDGVEEQPGEAGEPITDPRKITIPVNAKEMTIGPDGTVNYIAGPDDPNGGEEGQLMTAGKIIFAKFSNAEGLQKSGNNLFSPTANSGLPLFNYAVTSGIGAVATSTLEMSNVDLSEEFTEMIVAQRGFQANTRIITTSDEILQELVNLKR